MYKCAQTFSTALSFWNRIDIEVKSDDCYKPARALIEVYNTDDYSEVAYGGSYQIQFTTPIARTTVIVPPQQDSVWISIILRKQAAGTYCWNVENLDESDTMSRFLISRLDTNLYTQGYSYYNSWRDPLTTYVSTIYACSSSTERYLLRQGTIDTSGRYFTSSKAANLVIIE